ncbi:inner membrane protein YjjP [Clostridium ragsdalei P11]|uniref:Inner membrane protein YjjP n=1 Tax=Clostridium ragsdalei P11 TaxID=1353534 RepID=A0A1A6AXV0_9CLOT|nr:threonine/serine exporter family protein [Clostridium ragsdalei]OBR94858.1 inner membrane protein YjjP [Clostridium ragsdalei P11]
MDINRIINLAAYAGKIMLKSGAEIYRVEETITRICKSYDICDVDAFVTLNVIIVSASDEYNQTISIVKRVKQRTLNLEKISQVNNVSRHIKDQCYTLDSIENKLSKIDSVKPYPFRANVLFSGVAVSFLCLAYGGNIVDFIISFIIGCLISLISTGLNSLQTNEFFINIICGATAALIALMCTKLHIASHTNTIIISSIMLLVPGLAITNAIRDTISGDLISGISRGLEAFLVAVAIAAGTGVILRLWIILGGFKL